MGEGSGRGRSHRWRQKRHSGVRVFNRQLQQIQRIDEELRAKMQDYSAISHSVHAAERKRTYVWRHW